MIFEKAMGVCQAPGMRTMWGLDMFVVIAVDFEREDVEVLG